MLAVVEEVSARRLRAQILPEKFLLKSPGPRNYYGFSAHKKTVFVVKEEMGPRCLLAQIVSFINFLQQQKNEAVNVETVKFALCVEPSTNTLHFLMVGFKPTVCRFKFYF